MEEQKTLLQQIAAKESQLNMSLEQAAREAESIVSEAKRQAGMVIRAADARGRETAARRLEQETEQTGREVEAIESKGAEEGLALRRKADKNMPAAVEAIIRQVASD
jgi:vacuolar-type H+-ATPase subunit H